MNWTDELHKAAISIANFVNRSDIDARLLATAGVKLDRALFPVLSRIGLSAGISTVALANLIGRDHSTISRQVARLEELGLVEKASSPADARVRLLFVSSDGKSLLHKIRQGRRRFLERQFVSWSEEELLLLTRYLNRLTKTLNDEPIGE
jgi:DNA-binding MarR family transcriptional regulator